MTLMDVIFNISDIKIPRCLLCRKKVVKLIHSHVWPESLLRAFMDSKLMPESMKIFDASWKPYGYLQGPGQLAFHMLCKSCENIFSIFENLFKSEFYNVLHNDSCTPSLSTANECVVNVSCDNGNWLYLFCLSMVFRVLGLASRGFLGKYGNVDEMCKLFNTCRSLLLNNSVDCEDKNDIPPIALFFTPVHFLSKMEFPPFFMKVIFSMGIGTLCTVKLHDGSNTPKECPDFLLCSIADINIICGISKEAFKFVPKECVLTPTTNKFTIPSALGRFLLFPKGLFKEYEDLASQQMSRLFQVSSSRFSAKPNTSWAVEEKELYMKSCWSFKTEAASIDLNFLPHSFKTVKVKDKFLSMLNSPAESSTNVFLHYFDSGKTLSHLFVVKVAVSKGSSELQAFLHFEEEGCDVWMGYILSENDLSILKPLQLSKDKAEFFPEIEEKFNTRERVRVLVDAAIKQAGFESNNQFLQILKYRYVDSLKCINNNSIE